MPHARRRTLLLGLLLIAVCNGFALSAVMMNLNGTPESALTLTQRELDVNPGFLRMDEDSGMSLRLAWRVESVSWLDDESKLRALGIRKKHPETSDLSWNFNSPKVDVLLVLEMNGPAYARTLQTACDEPTVGEQSNETKRTHCSLERNDSSRLFVVDAGLDQRELRRQYPDREHYAIVRGQIQAWWQTTVAGPRLHGQIMGLAIGEIHVPMPLQLEIESSGGTPAASLPHGSPSFTARIYYGRRLEPWLAGITPMTSP